MKPNITCSECGEQAVTEIGQSIVNGELRWYYSSHCPHCGWAEEVDGGGKTPRVIREYLLCDEGKWALQFEGTYNAEFLKLARKSLRLSMLETGRLRDKSFITRGTLVEMQFIQNTFRDAGFELSLLSIGD